MDERPSFYATLIIVVFFFPGLNTNVHFNFFFSFIIWKLTQLFKECSFLLVFTFSESTLLGLKSTPCENKNDLKCPNFEWPRFLSNLLHIREWVLLVAPVGQKSTYFKINALCCNRWAECHSRRLQTLPGAQGLVQVNTGIQIRNGLQKLILVASSQWRSKNY